MMKKQRKMNVGLLSQITMVVFILFAFAACNSASKKEAKQATDVAEIEEMEAIVEVDVWVIDEHQINDIPVTSKVTSDKAQVEKAKKAAQKAKAEENEEELEAAEAVEEMEEEEAYEIYTMEAIDAALEEQEYIAKNTIELTEAIVPLDETQTVVSYNKKGKEKAALQVISSGPDNEIEQIIFTDKKHTDVYDVQAGMSGKEVKRLRRELKHMVKKGKVFLYDDSSNIMYLMDAQNMAGDEITVTDVENMDVQAVIWKDKKHHKKNK